MHPTLIIASRAAEAAAEKLVYTRENWNRLTEDAGPEKALNELYHGAAKRTINALRNAYPEQTIYFAHQGDEPEDPAETHWRADMLAGEDNFVRGLHEVGIIISQWQRGKMEQLVVVFPFLGLRAMASRGRGMQVGDRRVRCSQTDKLNQAVIAHSARTEAARTLVSLGADPRVTQCPLLDIVRVAAGHLDICLHDTVSPLELSAAQLLATEAGAMTGDMTGAPLQRTTRSLTMANPRLFKSVLSNLRQAD